MAGEQEPTRAAGPWRLARTVSAWWVGACVGASTERECWTSGGVWWLGLVVGFDFAEVSQFCFFLFSFALMGEYVLLTYVGRVALSSFTCQVCANMESSLDGLNIHARRRYGCIVEY